MAINTIAVCVGDNCIDHYLHPIERSFVGGNALNVAVYLQRGGIPSAYVGVVGNDDHGRLIKRSLQQTGVDISRLLTRPGMTSFTDIRLTPEGDRLFIHEHIGPQKVLELDDDVLHFICQHQLVHTTWLGGAQKYLPHFKQSQILISMDYGERYTPAFLESTIPYIDIAFFSLPEAESHRAKDLAQQAVGMGVQLAIVTLGREGSLAYDGKVYMHPAQPTQAVDTLGAGDTYIGVFLAHWLISQPIGQCMRLASQAAAYTCTHYGAWENQDYERETG